MLVCSVLIQHWMSALKSWPDLFKRKENASHDDILFAPPKTPEIALPSVVMRRGGEERTILENYAPAAFLRESLGEED